jgi:hypothetical protein
MEHNKHAYFFEKYLRNEMNIDEKVAFEKKLADNPQIKAQFDEFALNHDAIIRKELEEYTIEEIIPKKPQSYNWIWVLLSVLSLILIIDYYANQNYLEEQKQNKNYKEVLVNRLENAFVKPFKKNTNKAENGNPNSKNVLPKTPNLENIPSNPDSISANPAETNTTPETSTQVQETDILSYDTLLPVLDLLQYKETMNTTAFVADTLISDSLPKKQAAKYTNNPKPIYTEFWQSAIGFNGYLFTGKKLIIYGIKNTNETIILKQNNQFILHAEIGEIGLISDNQLHKFEN